MYTTPVKVQRYRMSTPEIRIDLGARTRTQTNVQLKFQRKCKYCNEILTCSWRIATTGIWVSTMTRYDFDITVATGLFPRHVINAWYNGAQRRFEFENFN
ncbi:unnamed protein product [Ceratitis capitata]|uniref:(Mediterranean fruit fly) hypothetical protein n=1 Tax=Ceratitis capitata TaxID=7213 RepID=A0A811UFN9_CERCA|nr:unnamed protein product [Ceratitis capitata]